MRKLSEVEIKSMRMYFFNNNTNIKKERCGMRESKEGKQKNIE
jgi:hypothetical protein